MTFDIKLQGHVDITRDYGFARLSRVKLVLLLVNARRDKEEVRGNPEAAGPVGLQAEARSGVLTAD